MLRKQIPAGKFKAECLKIMDDVQSKKIHIIITKHNVPVAEMVPIEDKPRSSFGWMSGTGEILGDIMKPIDEAWDANS
ncbi:MAG: type II toxin-antitoxin system Phd/YefM family antitoxin [Chlamydiales bacterium]|nr:type II toxin-antitoxin system Phd/YefM family antitoxin [Chlamydiales bacterium]